MSEIRGPVPNVWDKYNVLESTNTTFKNGSMSMYGNSNVGETNED